MRRIVALLFVLVFGALAVFLSKGISLFGITQKNSDSQIVNAIQRTQEVSLLSLGVQGIDERDTQGTSLLGAKIPGTTRRAFLMYKFRAKLGIDGGDVKISRTAKNTYTLSVPPFRFIGYSSPTFKLAVEDGGALSFVTPKIDKVDMVNDVLNSKNQASYLKSNNTMLREQTKVFYDSLITGIDPGAAITYEFR